MNKNFGKPVQDMSDDELFRQINSGIPDFGNLASNELTRRNLKILNKTISDGTLEAKKSSETAEKFTVALFLLAIVQLLVAIFQFILSFAYSDNTQAKIFGVVMVLITAIILGYFGPKIFKK